MLRVRQSTGRVYAASGRRRVELRTYPFQRQRCWPDDLGPVTAGTMSVASDAAAHPLLGARLRSPLVCAQFENTVGAASPAFMADHKVHGTPVFPAAGYFELAFEAARQALGRQDWTLEQVAIGEALRLDEGQQVVLQTLVSHAKRVRQRGVLPIVSASAAGHDASWREHVSGVIRSGTGSAEQKPADSLDVLRRVHGAIDVAGY